MGAIVFQRSGTVAADTNELAAGSALVIKGQRKDITLHIDLAAAGKFKDQRLSKQQEGHKTGDRVAGKADKRNTADFAFSNRFAGLHGDAPHLHLSELFNSSANEVGFAYAHAAAGQNEIGLAGGFAESF